MFVDDKSKHVNSLEEATMNTKTAYIGFRYGGADAEVAAFNPEIAKVEWQYFEKILDDTAAAKLKPAAP